jgi:hypothetical protein
LSGGKGTGLRGISGTSFVAAVRTSQKAVADTLFLISEDVDVLEELFPCSKLKTK